MPEQSIRQDGESTPETNPSEGPDGEPLPSEVATNETAGGLDDNDASEAASPASQGEEASSDTEADDPTQAPNPTEDEVDTSLTADTATQEDAKEKSETEAEEDAPEDDAGSDENEDDEEDLLDKPISKDEGGSPAWITTFADLMSLLMCFFVMLLSMSSLEMTTYKEMVQSMKEGFGLSSGDDVENITAEEVIDEAAVLQAAAKMKTQKDAANLREVLRDEVQDGLVEVEEGDQLITIQILQAGSFSAGSADLKDSFGEVAERLRGAIKGITGAISITGHTDDSPISTRRFRSNWELSSARAYSVMHALFKGEELDETRFVLRGLAETRPRVPNDNPANRAKNRRVEIVIDQRDESLKNLNLARGTSAEDMAGRIIINAGNIDQFTDDVVKPQQLKLDEEAQKSKANP